MCRPNSGPAGQRCRLIHARERARGSSRAAFFFALAKRRSGRSMSKMLCRIALIALAQLSLCGVVNAAPLKLEKEQLKLGFIKLTDMAPLAIAYEKGYFEDEGLYVTLEPQANWKVILDRIITGELDGAHMLAGQPIGATIGFGTKADVISAFSMDLNGNAT